MEAPNSPAGGPRETGPVPGVPPLRQVDLPGGRVLVIRHEEATDAGRIGDLYDRLADDERYSRFFTVNRPPDSFIERMVGVADRGGVGLVALVVERSGDEQLIGEASYELLPDGDGELGITVEGRFRGWLGPYLLEALVEQARSHSVPNLQAEVLLSNRRMLSVLHSRGSVILDQYDSPATVRVAIGVAEVTPIWPDQHDKPRVLVENAGGFWPRARILGADGFQVSICPGPMRGGPRCPALVGEVCPLAAGADAIVVAQPASAAQTQALVEAHRLVHPDVPVCIASAPDRSDAPVGVAHISSRADSAAFVDFVQKLRKRLPEETRGC